MCRAMRPCDIPWADSVGRTNYLLTPAESAEAARRNAAEVERRVAAHARRVAAEMAAAGDPWRRRGPRRAKGKCHNCRSRFRGVYWCRSQGAWRAIITARGVTRCGGEWKDEAEAARAYDRLARSLLGAAAKLNFPEETPCQI